jgi:hypothetical protein
LTRVNDHDIYRHCLKLAKTILRRGNIKGQQLYVHVAEKKYWETELLRIYQFEGKNRGKLANLGLKHDGFVLGEPQPFTNFSEKHTFWNDNWDWRRFRSKPFHDGSEHFPLYDLEPQLDYISQKLDLTLRKRPTLNNTRFSIWGRMFEAAVALVETNAQQRLRFRLIHHSGWGTYYFEFYDDESEFLFALSEAGHIAGLGSLLFGDDQAHDAVNDFNLRDELLAGSTQNHVNSSLQNRYGKLCEIANSR